MYLTADFALEGADLFAPLCSRRSPHTIRILTELNRNPAMSPVQQVVKPRYNDLALLAEGLKRLFPAGDYTVDVCHCVLFEYESAS